MSHITQLKIIHLAISFSILVFYGVFFMLKVNFILPEDTAYLGLITAFTALVLCFLVFEKLFIKKIDNSKKEENFNSYRTFKIVQYSCLEGAIIFNLLIATGQTAAFNIYAAIVLWVFLILIHPTEKDFYSKFKTSRKI